MQIAVFTSNQPRHIALIEALTQVADKVFAVQECNTALPGVVDDFFRKSEVMQAYFRRVLDAEGAVFGRPRFVPEGVRTLSLKMGDLSRIEMNALGEALDADLFVVFGASYIKGPLCDLLQQRRALNIHMGVSPYYRGSSTNFWALYDRRPHYVGATIHLLTKGLDSGPILYHALPPGGATEPFLLGMLAVRAAIDSLTTRISNGALDELTPVPQDRRKELRYTRNADFTDEVAAEYLNRAPSAAEIGEALGKRSRAEFLCPHIDDARPLSSPFRPSVAKGGRSGAT